MKFFVGLITGLVIGAQLGIFAVCVDTLKQIKQSEE